jgi:oligosaccharyltransferase complex subunit beta
VELAFSATSLRTQRLSRQYLSFSISRARLTVPSSSGRKTGNAQFSRDIAAWTFQETLVFRVDNSTHYLASDPSQTPRDKYTTGDTVVFTTYISAFDGASGTWKRTSKLKDVQLEFTMLDPHIRTSLLPAAGEAGKYSVKFQVPDRHGVFKFIVDYKRKGYVAISLLWNDC